MRFLLMLFVLLFADHLKGQSFCVQDLQELSVHALKPFTLEVYDKADFKNKRLYEFKHLVSGIDAQMAGLDSFPQEIYLFTEVRHIDLLLNKIQDLRVDLKRLPNLTKLDFSHNRLIRISISGASILRELILRDNQLDSVLDLRACPMLSSIDISFNRIHNVLFAPEAEILELRLGQTELSSDNLLNCLSQNRAIEVLDISGYSLDDRIMGVIDDYTLRALELDNIQGVRVDEVLNLLCVNNLKFLSIANNGLESSDLSMLYFPSLVELDLTDNNFTDFPDFTFTDSIKRIYIKRCRFDFPPLELLRYQNLVIDADRHIVEKASAMLSPAYANQFYWRSARGL